ncbi:MAG: YhgE/Pip domain-containing protein [Burkholderiales bacterium]|nr:YhgE/Pip domain-containing protein [Burkholderiales bacterium]
MSPGQHLHQLVRSSWRVMATDLALFRRFPRLVLAALAIALVPAAYALIYLSSVWDPNAKTSTLPVGIVNLDQGSVHQGRTSNVGAELAQELMRSGEFGFRAMDNADGARQGVRLGRLAFAVIIPPDFSASALPGTLPGGGKVVVVLSEGNNYAAAGIARRFAAELGHQVNEALNEKRWEQVLLSADGSGKSLDMLRAGMAQLRTGARTYGEGMVRYNGLAAQLAAGLRQVGASTRSMEPRLPGEAELKALRNGTQRLAQRQREMGAGLEQLQLGAGRLTAGATQLQEETAGLPFVGEKIAQSAGELAGGGKQLSEGLGVALNANARMARGATRIEEGTARLTEGMGLLADNLRALAVQLPEDARLETFTRSGDELVRAAHKLRSGIELVESALPASLGKLDGSARGLADSVEPVLEVLAPVPNNGSAFAPNMIAMALWLGAVMSVYLFNMQRLSEEHAQAPALAKSLGRYAVPALLVLLQTLLTVLVLCFGLGVVVSDPFSFSLIMLAAGQAFLALVLLLLRAFGEVGKLIVILLLTLQLAAGGGVMPIELTADFFQAVHDWLPFTWVIRALRASLFGAYDGGWLLAWLEVVLIGLGALLLSSLVRPWKTVPAQDYRAAVEV